MEVVADDADRERFPLDLNASEPYEGREELRVPDREEARPDPELVAHRWEAAREG